MSTSKRAYKDVDPDYTDACEQQAKRQKELEQDAKHNVGRKIQGIVRSEFRKEINNKELELHHVDRKLNEARLMMDRLRACIISTYYGQINQSGKSEVPKMSGPPSSIHPTVKKHLGKRPPHHELHSHFKLGHTQPYSRPELLLNECMKSVHERSDSRYQQNKTPVHQPPVSVAVSDTSPYTAQEVPPSEITYDDRRARLKIKKKIIVGNVSKYIPVDHREANDKSSHKWMVYVRGPKLEPDISGFVKKVWFFLHHSYKPNDLVEIRCPPFHLTRRGWGEFPVRVQLHFVDPRNKKVDIIHQLKLDKTFSGLQSLGAETTVEVDLERDFFGPDTCNSSCYMRPTIDGFSTCNHVPTYGSSSSGLHAPKITSSCHIICSQSDTILPEQSPIFQESETDKTNSESVREVLNSSCGVQSTRNKSDNCLVEICDMCQPSLQVELETVKLGNSVQSLGEYNVTIIHETEECTDRKQTGQISVMLNDRQTEEENSISSAVAPDLHSCASSQKVQPASVNAPLTVIHKPQWIHPDTPHTTERPASFPLQISQPTGLDMHCCDTSKISTDVNAANKVKCRSEAVSVTSIEQNLKLSFDDQILKIDPSNQSRNSGPLTENELCLNPSSISTSAKQMCLSDPSSSPLVSVLPILSMMKVVRAPISGCGRSSPHVSLPVSQITAYTTSDSTQFTSEPCVLPLSQEVLRVKENPSPCMSDVQKVIIIQPHSSSNMPELVSTNAAGVEDKTLLPSKPSGPRQVSLLTGRIFSPQTISSSMTKMSSTSISKRESMLASNCEAIKQTPDQAAALGNYARERTKCVPQAGGPVLLIKTLNHLSLSVPPAASHLLCQSSTVTNQQITNMNGSVKPGLSSHLESVSMVNAGGSADSTVSLVSQSEVLKTQAYQNRQMNVTRTDTVLNVCGQDESHTINGQDCSAYPKMSAIGMTKFGRNSATILSPNVSSKSTTDEERKRNQYEVLMTWKRNRLLEKGKQVVKIPRDNLEGEADIIPELNLDDYTSLRALLKAAVQLHPLVEADVNKLTHPYCAESLEVWLSWTLGKQLASEWHRACFVLKYLKPLLGKSESFRGEQLMTTRQLVRWCRLHAFSPLAADPLESFHTSNVDQKNKWAFPRPSSFIIVKRKPEDADDVNSKPLQNICHNSSLTHADTLGIDLLAESAVCQPQVSSGCEEGVLEVVNDTALGTIKMTNRVQNSGGDNFSQDCLEPSDGALFIFDELRKRGLRLHASELQPGVMSYTAADMLYTAMQEFLADILRETVAVNASLSSQSAAVDITRKDVHQALSQLPEAAFSCNKFLGKTDGAIDDSGR